MQNKELISDLQRLLQITAESARTLCQNMNNVCGNFHEMVGAMR